LGSLENVSKDLERAGDQAERIGKSWVSEPPGAGQLEPDPSISVV
jgi:hypothetical protein